MTSREFIAAETGNTDRIILYREGLFWKAYERSAFALCSQVRPLKPTRKVLKSLNGGDLISVGFPSASETATLGDLAVIERSDDRLTVAVKRSIDEREFATWKSSIPVKVSVPKRKSVADDLDIASRGTAAGVDSMAGTPEHFTSTASSVGSLDSVSCEGIRFGRLVRFLRRLFGSAETQNMAETAEDLSSETSVQRIVQSLIDFNLADKTPMECMLFISELKNMLVKR